MTAARAPRRFVFASIWLLAGALGAAACRIEIGDEEETPLPTEISDPSFQTPRSGPTGAPAPSAPVARDCLARPVNVEKELLIVDAATVGGGRAANEIAGAPWSFRTHLEAIAGADAASGVALDWLSEWQTATSLPVDLTPGAARVNVPPRPRVLPMLLCPWLKRTPANGCDDSCGRCTARRLDMSAAPFRLLAIVNRPDLVARNEACGGVAGELRFVYTLMGGPMPQPLTVIFEYEVRDAHGGDARAWAQAVHALGDAPSGEAHAAAVEALTRRVVRTGTLARVRTNEIHFSRPLAGASAPDIAWEMRELAVGRSGADGRVGLYGVAVRHTPRLALQGTAALYEWIATHSGPILDHQDNALPADMQSGTAIVPDPTFTWAAPGVDRELMAAFNRNTCNGCHGGIAGTPFQHIAPAAGGRAGYASGPMAGALFPVQVSPFLRNEDLPKRAAALTALLCRSCGAAPAYGERVDAGAAPPVKTTDAGHYAPPVTTVDAGHYAPPVTTVDAGSYAPPVLRLDTALPVTYHPRPID